MERRASWGDRTVYSGRRVLTGRADEYVNPVGGITHLIAGLLAEYVDEGGDLENVQLTVQLGTRTTGRSHVIVSLHGFDRREDPDA